jgi:hypothetical protein
VIFQRAIPLIPASGEETAFRKFFRRDLHQGLVRNLSKESPPPAPQARPAANRRVRLYLSSHTSSMRQPL